MVDYIKNETWRKHQMALFSVLVFGMLLSGLVYIYFISAIVMETVDREYNIQKFKIIERQYQELEGNYLSLISRLNLEYAYSLGFIASENSSLSYLTRQIPVAQVNSGSASFGSDNGYEETIR